MSAFVPPEPPGFATASPRERAARIVTEVLAPVPLVIALLLVVGAHAADGWSGVGWGLLAALFCGVVPLGVIALGVRRGALTDKHIRMRRQRVLPMAVSLLPVVTGVALLYLLGAPAEVGALVVAMLVGLVAALAVTVWWQISLHNAVAGGTAMILLLALGPASPALVAAAASLPVAAGWSRLVLRAHTPAQVVAGTALGGVCALVFTLLR
ncbi:phosphatase PAP2 family protein [Kitasatospora sp. NPDC008115]|uniref:phosphatase PAP2 family protein n=1 Tax=Kitasatospora sp. NPDC008115 TaxID=3364022 RepID=UPI0036E90BAD